MRNFDDLTIEEILALKEPDLDRLIKVRCMNKGIPLVSESFDLEVPKKLPEPELPMYEFKDIYFTKLKDAEAVKEFVLREVQAYRTESWKPDSFSSFRQVKRDTYGFDIKTKMVYSQKQEQRFDGKKKQVEQEIEKYKKAKEKWKSAREAMIEIENGIRADYSFLYELKESVSRLVENFKIYLNVSDGDFDTSYRFFELGNRDLIESLVFPSREDDAKDDFYFVDLLKKECKKIAKAA